ncbi:TRAP transporter substrate-binding protein DctP [Luminiphilus sp.]|nr:TRAP transporter substrate-binding protein DctP [Luminiphilus sp.]
MKERTLLPVAVIGLLVLWLATVGLWAVDAQKIGQSSADRLPGAPVEPIEWKLVTTWPKGLPGLGSAPENFARRVGEMSNGRLTVRVYGAGEVVPPFEVFDAVAQGVAEMGHGAAYYWKGKIPASVFYTAVPFGMTAQEMNGWLHYGGGLELWRELYAPFGVRPFAGGSTGVQMAGWFNRELTSAADLDGLKMRIPGLAGEVFAASGGTAVRLAGGEIYTSMQTGVIDAVEWVGPYNDRTLGLMEVAEYYYYPGWHEPGAMLEFTVNQDAFDQLPQDLQAIVEGAARATNQDMLDEFTARNNQSLTTLLTEYSTKLRPLPDDVLDVLYINAVSALERLKADDPMAQKISASYEDFLEGVRRYHEISERAYLNARDRVLPPISFTDQ